MYWPNVPAVKYCANCETHLIYHKSLVQDKTKLCQSVVLFVQECNSLMIQKECISQDLDTNPIII